MPWRYNYWRKRPRRYWRRRFRRSLYRRHWRRRRRVRKRLYKRKLKTLYIKEWQPPSVKRLKIKGYYPLFSCTRERLSNNFNMYLESIAPQYVPGGGGFSICNFTLQSLYQEHLKLHNWWTQSNVNYPLIRYSGCTLKLFRPENTDFIFYYQNHYPMQASSLMYTSTQPSIMLLNNRKHIIKCKQNNSQRKPYTRIKIRPPSQFKSKWYFQKDIANLPLLMTIASAASLDRSYTNSNAQSTTIGFKTLNPLVFQNHSFKNIPTSGYTPKPGQLMFVTQNHSQNPKHVKISELTLLADTNEHYIGTSIADATSAMSTPSDFSGKLEKYLNDKTYWGNPFWHEWINGDYQIWFTNLSKQQLKQKYTSADQKLHDQDTGSPFVANTLPLTIECRYNPFRDDNQNEVFLVKITDLTPDYEYHIPPDKKELVISNLPLWACLWGYLDYQKKIAIYNSIDTNCLLVINSHSLDPTRHTTFIPIDDDFLNNKSPYRPNENMITEPDRQNWHPKVAFQIQTINDIACQGPFTAKLPKQISCEGHMQYCFYFKIGGSPAPMSELTAPTNQPKFPSPDNILTTTSLQSPTLPFEYQLYHFDQRRHQITEKALKRIKKYKESETPVLQITDPSATNYPSDSETSTSETEDSEKEEETLQQQLLRQRKQQKQLRHRINHLLRQLTNI
nr:MAG: ORF1 [TTV-like mini virus]